MLRWWLTPFRRTRPAPDAEVLGDLFVVGQAVQVRQGELARMLDKAVDLEAPARNQ